MTCLSDNLDHTLRPSATSLHLRSLYIAEPSPLDLQVGVHLQGNITDFRSDVFAFTIAVGPYEQTRGITRVSLNVLRDWLLVLQSSLINFSRTTQGKRKRS